MVSGSDNRALRGLSISILQSDELLISTLILRAYAYLSLIENGIIKSEHLATSDVSVKQTRRHVPPSYPGFAQTTCRRTSNIMRAIVVSLEV